ncbi:MAG: hypothetical protein KDK60_01245 [Chlamydiia bacterium]|nr:hypothetical protein [Chlamydiia bacterium]
MTFEKRPFLLLEILLALGLLALCAFPLLSSQLTCYKKGRETLVQLELERQAELIFYEALKKEIPKKTWDELSNQPVNSKIKDVPFVIDLPGVGKSQWLIHTHLFHCHNNDYTGPNRIIHYDVCFLKKKQKCTNQKPYARRFLVYGKKVEEKTGSNEEK